MNPQDLYNTPKVPGVYLFKNKINGKCYVGQAKVSLHRRLLHHKNNFEHDRYDAPLYKALKKYGWENFEFSILEQFDEESTKELRKKLDDLEMHYISLYNSYGATGYNQTKGSDGGIWGYKFTDEQRKRLSCNSEKSARIHAENMDRRIYVYDLETDELKMFRMWKDVCEYTGHHINHCKYILYFDRYLVAFSEEEIEHKKVIYKEKYKNINGSNKGTFRFLLTEEMKEDILNGITQKEYCKKYGVCKKTYINHRNSLIPDYKRVYKQKIDNNVFVAYYLLHPNVYDCAEHFDVDENYIFNKIRWVKELGLLSANIRKENDNCDYEENALKTHWISDKPENKKPNINPIAPKPQKVKVCTENIDDEFTLKFIIYYKKHPDLLKCANRFCKSLMFIGALYEECVNKGYITPQNSSSSEDEEPQKEIPSTQSEISDDSTGLNPSLSRTDVKFTQNVLF